MISFTELEKKYFDRPLSRGFICLYVSETVTMIAGGLAGLFVPIFLYNLFDHNLQKVVAYYGIGYLLYALTVFLGGRFLGRFGFKRALQVSVFFAVLFYVILYYISPANTAYLIVALVLVLALFRIFHWTPYHVDFAKFTNRRNRSRQISILLATASILGIFMPLIAGLIITRSGFGAIFWIAILLWLVSGIPY